MRTSTRRAPRASAASSPAMRPRYSATLFVVTPSDSETSWRTLPLGSMTTAPDADLVDQLAQQLLPLDQRERFPLRDEEGEGGVAHAPALGGGGVVLGAPLGVAQLLFHPKALFG